MPNSFWPFRRRPFGEVAEAALALMSDETPWRAGILSLHHASGVVVRNTGFYLSVAAGGVGLRLEGRDRRAVDKAYRQLKRRLLANAQAVHAQRIRGVLHGSQPPSLAVPAPTAPLEEPLEVVEERVRRLREAISLRT